MLHYYQYYIVAVIEQYNSIDHVCKMNIEQHNHVSIINVLAYHVKLETH